MLLLETSGRAGFVAVAVGADLKQVRRLDETRRHARDLAPAAAELLAAQGWKPRDVQAVVVSRGPGSYTGLRVGIMSAKTFAYAIRCALIAVDTFAVIAQQAPAEVLRLDVIADAQQDKVYIQRFRRTDAGMTAETALAIRAAAEWLCAWDSSVWVGGPGVRSLRTPLPQGCRRLPEAFADPQPESLLRVGFERYSAGVSDDFWNLAPCYLRPSSAEEKWHTRPESRG